jgi:hypothetical protein
MSKERLGEAEISLWHNEIDCYRFLSPQKKPPTTAHRRRSQRFAKPNTQLEKHAAEKKTAKTQRFAKPNTQLEKHAAEKKTAKTQRFAKPSTLLRGETAKPSTVPKGKNRTPRRTGVDRKEAPRSPIRDRQSTVLTGETAPISDTGQAKPSTRTLNSYLLPTTSISNS